MIYGILITALCVCWIIFGTSYLKIHPFLILLSASIFLAIGIEIPINEISSLIGKGFGKTFESIGLIIIYGTIIGVVLEHSNATHTIADKILKLLHNLPAPFIVSFIGYIVSIPVFCDSAFVILNSLNKSISHKTKTPLIGLTIALSTGLFAPHVLVPPTPGPLAAAANLELENIFLLIIFGGLIAFILILIGAFYSYHLSKKKIYSYQQNFQIDDSEIKSLPSFSKSISPIMIPIILMALGTLFNFNNSTFSSIFDFITLPVNSLLIGMLLSFQLISKEKFKSLYKIVEKGIINAAPILIITGMGGTIGIILQELPISTYIEEIEIDPKFGIILPFIIAAILKSAQGSSTVAIITTSSIIFPFLPLLQIDSEMGKVWAIISLGVGSMTVSHANDSYFWIVSQIGGIDIKTAYKTHTFATFIQGLSGLIITLIGFTLWKMI